jgi:hypothetical protein
VNVVEIMMFVFFLNVVIFAMIKQSVGVEGSKETDNEIEIIHYEYMVFV